MLCAAWSRRGFGAGAERSPRATRLILGIVFLGNSCVRSYIGGSKA